MDRSACPSLRRSSIFTPDGDDDEIEEERSNMLQHIASFTKVEIQ